MTDELGSSLMARYEQNPVLRALAQLVPFGIGGAADTLIAARVQRIREERLRTFFDELAAGRIELQPAVIQDEDFLHCYFSTIRAVLNTRRRQKIRFLARLLRESAGGPTPINSDEYEELLHILDELSYRELMILGTLAKYEAQHPIEPDDERGLARAKVFWDQFAGELGSSLGISPELVDPMLDRLERSGCYETFVGGFGYSKGKGKLTPLFFRLQERVGEITTA